MDVFDFNEDAPQHGAFFLFKDDEYFYIVHESSHAQMLQAGKTARLYFAAMAFELETRKCVKNRYF